MESNFFPGTGATEKLSFFMKIIVSHDVDHLHWTDHYKDLFIPKYLIRNSAYLLKRELIFSQYIKKLGLLSRNRQHRLPELIEFNEAHNVKSTFFVGMANGLGLSYSEDKALRTVEWLKAQGLGVGVHGIAYDDPQEIKNERDVFSLSGSEPDGIRMHYLRNSENTLRALSEVGYQYDSSLYEIKNPYHTEAGLLEFPVSSMDVYAVENGKTDVTTIRQKVQAELKKAEDRGLRYFTLIFHDVYFDEAYASLHYWYRYFIEHCVERGFEFISFESAMAEINA